ncbi:hypothetical protein O3G_MSEX014648 [Manduca sexta]|uniref:Adenylate cyclase n=1 Tax=Manduca sexta TaxID=7130 RepID=A0A922CZX0_MANSE|nr:hypothetical protein O3G_MSEX014648 [Manduca sexta]
MNGINTSAGKTGTVGEPRKDENKMKKSSVREKLMQIRSNITVEPIIACYIMSNVFSGLAVQNLNLEKACRVNLGYDDEVCSALNRRQTENYTMEEAEVQKLTASVQAWKNIVQTAFPCILVLFVGSWSDKTGKRKACILLPIVGEVLCCTSFILNTYFFYELPLEVTAEEVECERKVDADPIEHYSGTDHSVLHHVQRVLGTGRAELELGEGVSCELRLR